MAALMFLIRNWKSISICVITCSLIAFGVWMNHTVAENKNMKVEISDLSSEIDRMNKQDAADYVLLKTHETAKAQIEKELAAKKAALRKAKEQLDEATRNCLSVTLPDAYLDRLPKASY